VAALHSNTTQSPSCGPTRSRPKEVAAPCRFRWTTRAEIRTQALLARHAALTMRGGKVVRLTELPGEMAVKKN